MAILHVKTPNGTTKTVDLETMNITSSLQQNGWCKLPNGLIIQWSQPQLRGTPVGAYSYLYYPIQFSNNIFSIVTNHLNLDVSRPRPEINFEIHEMYLEFTVIYTNLPDANGMDMTCIVTGN